MLNEHTQAGVEYTSTFGPINGPRTDSDHTMLGQITSQGTTMTLFP